MCGCGGCAHSLNGVFVPGVGGELGKFSFKIKMPKMKFKAPKLKFKAPKLKLKIKAPKIKFKYPKVNFGKALKNFAKPFEDVGRSFTNMTTGMVDSFGNMNQQIMSAVGEKAPELIDAAAKIAPSLLAPGAGGMLSSLIPGLSDMMPGGENLSEGDDGVFRPSSSLMDNLMRPDTAPFYDAAKQAQLAPKGEQDNKTVMYIGLAAAGLFLASQMMSGRKAA